MRSALYAVCAILIAVAAAVLLVAGSPGGWPDIPDAAADHGVKPQPGPAPNPIPQGEDHWSAKERSRITGRPLLILMHAAWCEPCRWAERLYPALRAKGELAIVDVGREPAMYEHYCPGKAWGVPTLLVYSREGDSWRCTGCCRDANEVAAFAGSRERIGTVAAVKPNAPKAIPEAPIPGHDPAKPSGPVRLLVVYDGSPACKAMLPVLKTVEEAVPACTIVYANANDAANLKKIKQRFPNLDTANLPFLVTYIGHEAWETTAGVMSQEDLKAWLERTLRGEATQGQEAADSQSFLGPADRPMLRSVEAPGSCGMLGCLTHPGYLSLEVLDKAGNLVPDAVKGSDLPQTQPWPWEVEQPAASCPAGGCPATGHIGRRR